MDCALLCSVRVQDSPAVHVQLTSALVVQLVQSAAELPPADCSEEQLHEASRAPLHLCDRIWLALIDQ